MPGDVERARAHAALVTAAADLLGEQHARIPAADVERAHALRAVHLVRAERQQIDLQVVDVDRDLADRLHGVGVEQDPLLLRDRADLGDRLQHADLVVGGHDRDEDRLVGDGGAQLVETDAAVLLHRQIGDARALLLELLARVDDRLVLDHARDDVIALLAVHLRDALDRQVVRFGRAAREDDFLRAGANQIGHLLAGSLHRLLGFPAERVVAAGGVAEVLCEVRRHRLEHPWVDGRRGVVVHVNRKLHLHSSGRSKGPALRNHAPRRTTATGAANVGS